MSREKSFDRADEIRWFAETRERRIKAEAFQQRINALPTRLRLEAYRRANAGESLIAVVKELEAGQ